MSFVVLYDANVLYPSTLRDLLIRIAGAGLVQAKWTEQILDEVFRNIRKNRPELSAGQLERTRSLMLTSVRDCLATDNLKDFPAEALRQWDIDPKDADDFISDQIGLDAKVVWSCVQQIANTWRNPPGTIGDVLASLERCGLVQSVAALRAL
ncbi:PIN domain-containing protein [Lentzea sp. NPDC059081]|uniref:PIN domain-containing protein n=1 Tax=Lentzea sp. NPDC059081 TaxID=3346719 RepID=UPI00369F2D88